MDKKTLLKRLKQISAIVSLLAMSTNNTGVKAEQQYDLLPKIFYTMDNPTNAEYLYSVLCELPDSILKKLINNNTRVIILNNEDGSEKIYEELYNDKSPGTIIGITLPNITTSFVEGGAQDEYYKKYLAKKGKLSRDEFNKKIEKNILIHEVGHLIDILEEYKLSSSDEFIDIYQKESKLISKTKICNIDDLSLNWSFPNATEYFGLSFSCYFCFPNDLKEFCPETYNYINTYILELEKETMINNNKK